MSVPLICARLSRASLIACFCFRCSGTTIAIIVVVVVLLVALAAAGVALFVMRRKRNAELAEMRATPQAR